jgi:glyoxylase-like metal-dependent hydrolase (beta-lactamase superfamily II)
VFCGDSLFNIDVGSARCDFPGGSATSLYASARKLLDLPEHVKIYTGHDYPPGADAGRSDPVPFHTVAEHRRENKHLRDGVKEQEYVQWRSERDSGLAAPKLIHQAMQFNLRGGSLPAPSSGGDRLLHIPITLPAGGW